MGKGDKKKEWLPWYRREVYRGDLTEAEKRELDSFRMQPRHPAARSEDLPEEVQNYINRIEIELYDSKQSRSFNKLLFVSFASIMLIFFNFYYKSEANIWMYIMPVLLIILSCHLYVRENKKNREDWRLTDEDGVPNTTDDQIMYEWEMEYLVNKRKENRVS